eukprot:scaffold3054_cov129-Cylindrotheca_fusiformis.AAC.16
MVDQVTWCHRFKYTPELHHISLPHHSASDIVRCAEFLFWQVWVNEERAHAETGGSDLMTRNNAEFDIKHRSVLSVADSVCKLVPEGQKWIEDGPDQKISSVEVSGIQQCIVSLWRVRKNRSAVSFHGPEILACESASHATFREEKWVPFSSWFQYKFLLGIIRVKHELIFSTRCVNLGILHVNGLLVVYVAWHYNH